MQPDMNQMLSLAQQKMEKMQRELTNAKFEGQAGGGAVKITCTGDLNFTYVKIKPEAIDTTDLGLLEDLVLRAINDATEKAKTAAASKMSTLLPPGMMPPGMGF